MEINAGVFLQKHPLLIRQKTDRKSKCLHKYPLDMFGSLVACINVNTFLSTCW